ncbi:MAG TPA: hypothetical protein VGO04_23565 [Ensifer sp.]|jgi:hypothetical protein|uniref:hypothetical protein n=1 Tax=Ensifer sp. TaxID=1872086 RepID=UPI002E1449C8|nr:hypothetical protein [Ensifer sp.]
MKDKTSQPEAGRVIGDLSWTCGGGRMFAQAVLGEMIASRLAAKHPQEHRIIRLSIVSDD